MKMVQIKLFLKISDNLKKNENTFRGGYHDKLYIKIFGIYRTIDMWKIRVGWFCLNEMRRKDAKAL